MDLLILIPLLIFVKEDKIIKKFHPEVPQRLENIVKCQNSRCITSIEKDLEQVFILTDKENQVYHCRYLRQVWRNKFNINL